MSAEGLSAVVARTDGNAEAVEDGRCVMRMDAVDGEGNDAGLFRRIGAADDVDVRNLFHPFQTAFGQGFFVSFDLVHAEVFQVVDGCVEGDGAFDVCEPASN